MAITMPGGEHAGLRGAGFLILQQKHLKLYIPIKHA